MTLLDEFRQEIASRKNEELQKRDRGEKYNPHFEYIEPKDLTEGDMITDAYVCGWEKLQIKDPEWAHECTEQFRYYQELVLKSGNSSRITFSAYLSNRVMIALGSALLLDAANQQ